jgi:outer membrane protein assembly factor BamD
MKRWILRALMVSACFLILPRQTPAPLIFRAGEGWYYEPVGGGSWVRQLPREQLEISEQAFEKGEFEVALRSALRTVRVWPYSDYAPKAQYMVGRCYEEKNWDERAFKEYQKLLEKYPKIEAYEEVLGRQYAIAHRFLEGQRFRLWGRIPLFASMDKTSQMYEKVIKNGPYSIVAPQAQLDIGAAREKQSSFLNRISPYREAVKAYETAADRYHDRPVVAAEALYKAGLAYQKQARKAEYDQSVAGRAITTFSDFVTLYPDDPRVPEVKQIMQELRTEQSRGSFEIARYYETQERWDGALVYYNEALIKDPDSVYAQRAKSRIEELNRLREERNQ